MNPVHAVDITPWHMLWLILPFAGAWVVLRHHRLGFDKRLLSGIVRCALQLAIMGFVLLPIFDAGPGPLTVLVITCMCALAALLALQNLRSLLGRGVWSLAFMATLPVVLGLTLFAMLVVIPDIPWLEPRYAIALAGMLAGNAMNAISLSGERFVTGLREQRSAVEFAFACGAAPHEAVRPQMSAALRAAILPSLNSLAAVGLVSIPGMMTGQLMSGQDPLIAARYQFMIMALWICAAAAAPALFLTLLRHRLLHSARLKA